METKNQVTIAHLHRNNFAKIHHHEVIDQEFWFKFQNGNIKYTRILEPAKRGGESTYVLYARNLFFTDDLIIPYEMHDELMDLFDSIIEDDATLHFNKISK